MRFFAFAVVLALVTLAFTYTEQYALTYVIAYDDPQHSLKSVACSDGEYGLLTAGYKTFGSIPTFPSIGGAPQIMSWNSRYCGTCWQLTYTDAQGASTRLNFTAIDTGDSGGDGFSISLDSMNVLTNGCGESLGRIPVTATQLPVSACHLDMQEV